MRPRERRESGEQDLFRSRLDQVINMDHALVRLARTIDWRFLEEKFGAVSADGSGRPPLDRNYLAGRSGDANNAILAATGYNFRRLIRWLSDFLRLFLAMLLLSVECRQACNRHSGDRATRRQYEAVEVDEALERGSQRLRVIVAGRLDVAGGMKPRSGDARSEEA